MTIEINAGETFDVSCPTNESPILRLGDKLPDDKSSIVKVLKIQKETVTLGPFKSGPILLTIPCTNSKTSVEVNVKEINQTLTLQRFPSLDAKKVDLPLSFFSILIVILLSFVGTFLYLKKKKQNSACLEELKTPKKNPRLELEKHIAFCELTVKNPESLHFHDTYKLLRKFLESENKLNTRSLTTDEFLGTFRALGLKQSSNQQFLSQLEFVLKISDDIRFAKKSINAQIWTDYLLKIKSILSAFPTKNETYKTTQDGKMK